jgi:hypothetical protein
MEAGPSMLRGAEDRIGRTVSGGAADHDHAIGALLVDRRPLPGAGAPSVPRLALPEHERFAADAFREAVSARRSPRVRRDRVDDSRSQPARGSLFLRVAADAARCELVLEPLRLASRANVPLIAKSTKRDL